MAWQIWREWREYRAAWLLVGVVMPLATIALSKWNEGEALLFREISSTLGLVAMLAVWVAVGLPLFSTDWHKQRGLWLARTPAGLSHALLAKWAFLIVAMLLTFLWVAGFASAWIRWTNLPSSLATTGFPEFIASHPLAVLAWCTWALAPAAWGLRSGVALFAGPILAFALTYPLLIVLRQPYLPGLTTQAWPWAVSLAAALASISLAYVGYRPQRRLRPLVLAIGIAIAGNLPGWASVAHEHWQRNHVVPGTENFAMFDVHLGPSHQFAFVNAKSRRTPGEMVDTFRIDLRTDEWQRLGRYRQGLMNVEAVPGRAPFRYHRTNTIALMYQGSPGEKEPEHNPWDSETGEPLRGWSQTALPYCPWADSGVFEGVPYLVVHPTGFGHQVIPAPNLGRQNKGAREPDRKHTYYDSIRNRITTLDWADGSMRYILPSAYLVERSDEHGQSWHQRDPETGAWRADPILLESDFVAACTESGKLLVQREQRLYSYDVANTILRPVHSADNAPWQKGYLTCVSERAPIGDLAPPSFRVGVRENGESVYYLCWYDEAAETMHWQRKSVSWGQFLSTSAPGRSTYLVNRDRIVDLDMRSGEATILYPKAKP